MLSLYVILAVIAFFNFNIHHLVVKEFTNVKKAESRAVEQESGNTVGENRKRELPEENRMLSSD